MPRDHAKLNPKNRSKVIRCVGLASGEPLHEGLYLASYDPEAFNGRGHIAWTDDPAKALRFEGLAAAIGLYQAVPTCHPVRLTDGKPNRPLTAYNVVIEEAP